MAIGYGFYIGGDPRKFHPDSEDCSAEEMANHAAACLLWNDMEANGETPTPEKCPSGFRTAKDGMVFHVLKAPYGIGTYEYPDKWDDADYDPNTDEDEN